MTDFKSNETVQSTHSDDEERSDDSSTENNIQPKPGILNLIPPFVRSLCSKPKLVELNVCYDAPTIQSTYTYSITWEDDDDGDGDEEYQQILEKIRQKTSDGESDGTKKSVISALPSTPTTTAISDDPTQGSSSYFSSTSSNHDIRPVTMFCDGPCNKSFPSHQLLTIARCDHYMCAACYGIVTNSDGTPGCSGVGCYLKGGETRNEAKKLFEKEVCRKQRTRARVMKSLGADVKSASQISISDGSFSSIKPPITESECSTETDCTIYATSIPSRQSIKSIKSVCKLTYPSKNEIIAVKLIILQSVKAFGHEIVTNESARSEFQSSTPIQTAITTLIVQKFKQIPRHHKGKLFHVELQTDWKRAACRIRTRDYKTQLLHEYSQVGDHIVFIVDFATCIVDGSIVKYC